MFSFSAAQITPGEHPTPHTSHETVAHLHKISTVTISKTHHISTHFHFWAVTLWKKDSLYQLKIQNFVLTDISTCSVNLSRPLFSWSVPSPRVPQFGSHCPGLFCTMCSSASSLRESVRRCAAASWKWSSTYCVHKSRKEVAARQKNLRRWTSQNMTHMLVKQWKKILENEIQVCFVRNSNKRKTPLLDHCAKPLKGWSWFCHSSLFYWSIWVQSSREMKGETYSWNSLCFQSKWSEISMLHMTACICTCK